jgi:hypothetical protein
MAIHYERCYQWKILQILYVAVLEFLLQKLEYKTIYMFLIMILVFFYDTLAWTLQATHGSWPLSYVAVSTFYIMTEADGGKCCASDSCCISQVSSHLSFPFFLLRRIMFKLSTGAMSYSTKNHMSAMTQKTSWEIKQAHVRFEVLMASSMKMSLLGYSAV